MTDRGAAQPFLKWAGGKRQLLPDIDKYRPRQADTYFEPFVGAGAVLFHLKPSRAVINDVNAQLINAYDMIKHQVDALVEDLKRHRNEKDYFYELRDADRQPGFEEWSSVRKASRIIYLNKTCFNGLFRVNSQGHFNVPFGKYKNPQIVNETVLRAVSRYLNENEVRILEPQDFVQAVRPAKKGDFVYFDPPYDPVTQTSSFTGYSLNGFRREDQVRLRDTFVDLDRRGCKILLSNSATDFIKELYQEYRIEIVSASRNINSVAAKRGKIDEVLVMNYDPGEKA